jgi:23S rRNA (uracil1939-C5)-methyltransferase
VTLNENMRLKIEKMIYGGEGLARIPSDGGRSKAVFVPFVIPGEEAEVNLREEKRGFARAELVKVVTPSPERVEPGCEYFFQCGGCQYQHIDYKHQPKYKEQILRETLARTAKFEWKEEIAVHSAQEWGYRNRTRLHVRQGTSGFAAGYFRANTHQLLPVKHCPISSPQLNRAIACLWELGAASAVPASVKEIEFFADGDDHRLLLELYCIEPDATQLETFWTAWREKVPDAVGIAAFNLPTAQAPAPKQVWNSGELALGYQVAGSSYRVTAGSFFQVNRFLVAKMVEVATRDLSGAAALDLYAGAGLFTLPFAAVFESVTAVEIAPYSFADLQHNAPKNVECIRKTTEEFLSGKPRNLDAVIVDPPRAGLGEKAAADLAKWRAKNIVYVSCDPATLARDLKVLLLGGYRIDTIDLLDLFPQTFHLETVVKLFI